MEGAAVVGEGVGSLVVGALDGCFVGLDVGSFVGALEEGAAVVGEDVGSLVVGALDGCFVGLDVGSFVGALEEGAAVVGEGVGSLVGALDGCFVGLDVESLPVLPCSANQSNVIGSPQGVDGSMKSEFGFESMKLWPLPGIA